jgi:predicted dienelactone hydrolase
VSKRLRRLMEIVAAEGKKLAETITFRLIAVEEWANRSCDDRDTPRGVSFPENFEFGGSEMSRLSGWIMSATGALCVAACCLSASGASASVGETKTEPIASTTIVFTDHSRSTPAANGTPAVPSRTLSTLIVYPKLGERHHAFPLVVFSHGFGATAASLRATMDALASHGYVVAAPDFPRSTSGLPGGLNLLDFKHQPGDVSFVITQMLKQNSSPGSPVYQEIEHNRIGVMGHSLGAVTTLAVAYNSCCRDARIRAAVEMDGELNVPVGPLGQFPGTYFKGHNPPLLVVNGTKDTIGPYAIARSIYAKAPAPKYFLSLIGAPHSGFAMAPWAPTADKAIVAFFDRYLGPGQTVTQIKQAGTQHGIATMQVDAG